MVNFILFVLRLLTGISFLLFNLGLVAVYLSYIGVLGLIFYYADYGGILSLSSIPRIPGQAINNLDRFVSAITPAVFNRAFAESYVIAGKQALFNMLSFFIYGILAHFIYLFIKKIAIKINNYDRTISI